MSYYIERTEASTYKVFETGFKPLLLAECNTEDEAEAEIKMWEKIDRIKEWFEDAIDELAEELGEKPSELEEFIKKHVGNPLD